MQIFRNGEFKIAYTPAIDLLKVTLPDMSSTRLVDAKSFFDILLENVKNYNVQCLLFNTSNAQIKSHEEGEYYHLIYYVSMRLLKTNIKKVARVVSKDHKFEDMAGMVQNDVAKFLRLPFQIRNFPNKQEAKEWLMEK